MLSDSLRQWFMVLGCVMLLSACASGPAKNHDYAAFKASKPASILVLPPTNTTPSVRASDSVWAQITQPLAESGYYVFPVSLVNESLKQNGVTQAAEAHELPLKRLKDVFGADAVLYLEVTEYGTVFKIVDSITTVSINARLVDAHTAQTLWEGKASASDAEHRQQQQSGLLGALISAVAHQIASNMKDVSHPLAGRASSRLLSAGSPNGLLFGPRHPKYESQFAIEPTKK